MTSTPRSHAEHFDEADPFERATCDVLPLAPKARSGGFELRDYQAKSFASSSKQSPFCRDGPGSWNAVMVPMEPIQSLTLHSPKKEWHRHLNPAVSLACNACLFKIHDLMRRSAMEYLEDPTGGVSTERPLVSVLVLGYNQESIIRKAVEGAFAQTWAPLEIVLSDDCSTDRTFDIMREMAAAYSGPHRIVLNRNDRNMGIAGNVNRLMEISTGAFVLKFDGDDISLPQRAERLVRAWLESGGKNKLVFSEVMRIDDEGTIRSRTGIDKEYAAVNEPTPLEIIKRPMFALGAASGWSRELFDRFGPIWDGAIVEDIVLPFRAAAIGQIAFVDEPLVLWRMGGSTDPDYSRGVGYAQMYGHGLHITRLDLASMRAIALDMEKLEFPAKDECRRWCGFHIACWAHRRRVAGASTSTRLFSLPRSIWLSLRHRSPFFATTNLRYVFDRITMRYLDRKAAREADSGGPSAT